MRQNVVGINFPDISTVNVTHSDGREFCITTIDSITYVDEANIDTISVYYTDNGVSIYNPQYDKVNICVDNCDVVLSASGCIGLVICLSGQADDGRLVVNSDEEYSLLLNNINLTSQHAPAFNSMGKGNVGFVLPEGSDNYFSDAKDYSFADTVETASGCINVLGKLSFSGRGSLSVEGLNKHAIRAKKSIEFDECEVNVISSSSDGIHSGKNITVNSGTINVHNIDGDAFDASDDITINGGIITIDIAGEAAKGLKCNKALNVNSGVINATLSGALKNKKGDLSYCAAMKCDSLVLISGGEINITNTSPGGRGISADKKLIVGGGNINVTIIGDGAEYTNEAGEIDYYTGKCFLSNDSLLLWGGNIRCLSTGFGAKGIVADVYLEIGSPSDTVYTQGPTLYVETTNTCILDDKDEDERNGCPKAIKSDSILNMYSGDVTIRTHAVGGEGVECNKDFTFYGGQLYCMTYDDGINVKEKFVMQGGLIFTYSENNDGIDSNGMIELAGGTVVAQNGLRPNESLDSEQGQLFLTGATVLGIGSSPARVSKADNPCFNSTHDELDGMIGFDMENGIYVYILKGGEIFAAFKNLNKSYRQYITFTSPQFSDIDMISICKGNEPKDIFGDKRSYFDGNFIIGGVPDNIDFLLDFNINN